MEPPGKENATGEGGALKTDDAGTLTDTQPACKKQFPDWPADVVTAKSLRGDRRTDGKPLAPAGHAWENGKIVPIVEPEMFTPEEKQRLDVILPVTRWAIGSKARLAALEFLSRLDERKTLREIANFHRISPSAAHRAVRELRAFLGALR